MSLARRLKAPRADVVEPPPVPEPRAPVEEDRWAKIRDDASRLAPGYLGFVRWVDRCRVDSGMGVHPMPEVWDRHLGDFYSSGKFEDVGRFGLRASKSENISIAITGETLLILRSLPGSTVGVCPVLSASTREASGRFETIRANLRACGFADAAGSKGYPDPFEFRTSGGGSISLKIETRDSQGHPVEFRVYPASESGAAGFTAVAGFGDELDLWGKDHGANPAAAVLGVLRARFATQPEARLHLMSASYDRDSEHARLVSGGSTMGRHVATIGAVGSALDHASRLRLAAALRSRDPRLLAPPLPHGCHDIPTWVANPTLVPIERAWALSNGDLGNMFGLYGGRIKGEADDGEADEGWIVGRSRYGAEISHRSRSRGS